MLLELREFFTLGRSDRAAAAAGEELAVRSLARLAEQRIRAAETLAASNQWAESERLADEAIALLREIQARYAAVGALVEPLPEPSERAMDGAPPTARLDEVFDHSDAREALLVRLEALGRCANAIHGVALGREGRRDARWQRIGALVSAALLAAIVGVRQARVIKLTASCSASYDAPHAAQYAIDGYLASNWVLPDNVPGWLEVAFERRVVRKLELINAQGLSMYGVKSATVELYRGPALVRSVDISMDTTVGTPNPTTVPLLLTQPIDRIRIQVKTWHGYGGGLSEVRVE